MGIIKRLKWKDKTGKTTDYDLGAKASNVEQDATHRFVSDTEKQTWNGKADPEDIPSGSAADYGVANNDTTNRTDMLVTAQVAYQHGKEIDQLNSEFADRLQGDVRIIPEGSGANTKYYAQVGADAGSKKELGEPYPYPDITISGYGSDAGTTISKPFGYNYIRCNSVNRGSAYIHLDGNNSASDRVQAGSVVDISSASSLRLDFQVASFTMYK